MQKQKLSDFQRALLDVKLEQYADIPENEASIDVTFSPGFLSKSQELIHKSKRNYYSRSRTVARRIALVAIITLMLALTACAIPAVREAIIDFFFRDAGDHYSFTYDAEQAAHAPDIIETVYRPTYVVDGFELMIEDVSAAGVTFMWCNSDDAWINYIQRVIPDDPTVGDGGGFNSEGAVTEWIVINDCKVLRIEDDEWIHYVWTSSEYEFSISIDDKTLEHELEKIFDSIRVDPNALIIETE